mmetsp:Transcript_43396/g.70405  ORF Transcript_43396/g.70405 Transcript_43396/m.70405 type:complete len:277 (+) Transcript_43396:211-1041(+)
MTSKTIFLASVLLASFAVSCVAVTNCDLTAALDCPKRICQSTGQFCLLDPLGHCRCPGNCTTQALSTCPDIYCKSTFRQCATSKTTGKCDCPTYVSPCLNLPRAQCPTVTCPTDRALRKCVWTTACGCPTPTPTKTPTRKVPVCSDFNGKPDYCSRTTCPYAVTLTAGSKTAPCRYSTAGQCYCPGSSYTCGLASTGICTKVNCPNSFSKCVLATSGLTQVCTGCPRRASLLLQPEGTSYEEDGQQEVEQEESMPADMEHDDDVVVANIAKEPNAL